MSPRWMAKPLKTTAGEVTSFRQTFTFIFMCELVPSSVSTDRMSTKKWRRFQKRLDFLHLRVPLDLEFCYDTFTLSNK